MEFDVENMVNSAYEQIVMRAQMRKVMRWSESSKASQTR